MRRDVMETTRYFTPLRSARDADRQAGQRGRWGEEARWQTKAAGVPGPTGLHCVRPSRSSRRATAMSRFTRLAVVLLGLVLSVGMGQETSRAGTPKADTHTTGKLRTVALWVWNADVLTRDSEQARIFALCRRKGIRLLFVNVGGRFSPEQNASDSSASAWDELAQFVGAAHQRGIKVHALDGNPHWALPTEHTAPVTRLTRALEYNQAVPVQDRLDGFQFDIEPYLLPDLATAKGESILSGYLDLLAALCHLVNDRQPDFELGVALPFWLDGESGLGTVAWKQRSQPFTFHAMDQLDTISNGYIAVMAYRDFTDGADGSIRHATDEIVYAHEHARKVRVFVGQETAEVKGDPEKITFFEEGSAALDKAIRELAAAFNQYPRFAGVAVHHYDSYKVWFDSPTAQSAGPGVIPQPPFPVFQVTKPKSGTLTTEKGIVVEGLGGRTECVIRVFVQPRGMKRAYQQPGHATVHGEEGAWRFETCNLAGSGRTLYTSGQMQVYAEMYSKAGQVLARTKPVTVRRKAIVITSPADGWNARQRLFTVRGYAFGFRPGTKIQIIVQTDIGYEQDNPGIVGKDGCWQSTGNVLGGYPVPYTHYVWGQVGDIESNTVRIIKRGE